MRYRRVQTSVSPSRVNDCALLTNGAVFCIAALPSLLGVATCDLSSDEIPITVRRRATAKNCVGVVVALLAIVAGQLLLFITLMIALMPYGVQASPYREGATRTQHHESRKNELRAWSENRYIKCLFCMDYDDYEHLSVFGCNAADLPTCYGNACYMRQHKDNKFFLYTSGCLNITENDYAEIRERTANVKPARGKSGNETQLCEVTLTINTCLCTNRHACNNISSVEPFSEFTEFIFKDTNFDEVAHFRHFLPYDPILKDPNAAILRRSGNNTDQYVLLSRSAALDAPASVYFIRGRFARRKCAVAIIVLLLTVLLSFLSTFLFK